MEAIRNYTVTSDPKAANNDGDANSDFAEFQNGSHPWRADTDGAGLDAMGVGVDSTAATGLLCACLASLPASTAPLIGPLV